MKKRLTTATVLAVVIGGCLGGDDRSAEVERGKQLFTESGCGDCHTLGEAGAKGKVGPSLDAVRPDFRATQQQVTSGGRGMPAFGDRLSSEEIVAIARYVSDSAGKSLGAVTARYEPDDTRLAQCDGPRDQPCYQQAFANHAYRDGPRRALKLLGSRMQTDRAVANGCHRIAHSMGGAALVRFDDEVGAAFAEGDSVCSSGYYHGILEHSFAGVDDDELGDKARGLCSGGSLARSPFLKFQCIHGLGHGLMLRTRYDLPTSLDVCEQVAKAIYSGACEGGVFMENFTSFYEVSSKWRREDDLIYPCNVVAERRKSACYMIVTAYMLDQLNHDWRKTARACREAEPDWVYMCFRSFGRDAISQNAYRQRPARRLCRLAGDMESQCVLSVALHITQEERGVEGAARWCRNTPDRLQVDCYAGLGSTAILVYGTRLPTICNRLTRDALERFACSSGQSPEALTIE